MYNFPIGLKCSCRVFRNWDILKSTWVDFFLNFKKIITIKVLQHVRRKYLGYARSHFITQMVRKLSFFTQYDRKSLFDSLRNVSNIKFIWLKIFGYKSSKTEIVFDDLQISPTHVPTKNVSNPGSHTILRRICHYYEKNTIPVFLASSAL